MTRNCPRGIYVDNSQQFLIESTRRETVTLVVSSRDDKTPLVALFGQACIIRKKLVDDT